jgi:hypothetical protein
MALSATTNGKSVFGNKRVAFGTATIASGDTQGSISCGFVIDYAVVTGQDYAAGGYSVYTTSSIHAYFTDPSGNKNLNWFAFGHG